MHFIRVIITSKWWLFVDSTEKSLWLLLCNESPYDVTKKSSCDSHVSVFWRLNFEVFTVMSNKITTIIWCLSCNQGSSMKSPLRSFAKSPQMISFYYHLGTCHKVTANRNFTMNTWQSIDDFIIKSPGNSTQSNSHSDFSTKCPNESNNEMHHISIQCNDCGTCSHLRCQGDIIATGCVVWAESIGHTCRWNFFLLNNQMNGN